MSDLDDAFKKLISDVRTGKANKPKPEPIRYGQPGRMPDAVVLVHFVASCIKCGNVFEYPNKHLLLRYGKDLTRPKKWLFVYSTVAREVLTWKEKVDACCECLDDGALPFYDIRQKP